MPVSMFCFGSGVSEPSACSSNSMNTRFQNSRKRSHSQPGAHSGRPQPVPAPVVEHLRVGAARAGAADRPEVVRAGQPHDPLRRHADPLPGGHGHLVLVEPELRVAGEDGHPDPVQVELHVLEHELPGELDRAVLEVLAEREVAEHLEEGQVVAVEPDLVDVRRAEDLLHRRQQRRRRLLAAEEERHQRLHPRRDEQRRAVVRRAGSAAPRDGTCGPWTRRTRGSPRGARRSCAPERAAG